MIANNNDNGNGNNYDNDNNDDNADCRYIIRAIINTNNYFFKLCILMLYTKK